MHTSARFFVYAVFKVRVDYSTVEMKGFEPLTPCLQGRCSPN